MLHSQTLRTRSIGWAFFGVNFTPLQEIEAIIGGGRILGPFSRDYGITIHHEKSQLNKLVWGCHGNFGPVEKLVWGTKISGPFFPENFGPPVGPTLLCA